MPDWLERNRVGYIFGLGGNAVLLAKARPLAEDAAMARVEDEDGKVRRYGEFPYAARTWMVERHVIARVEASAQGSDSRFVVTNLKGAPRWLYEDVYCARGQAENLIKAHKLHLASDRTSCSKATANQFRLLVHTAAYWLLHSLRALAPKTSFWRDAQFDLRVEHFPTSENRPQGQNALACDIGVLCRENSICSISEAYRPDNNGISRVAPCSIGLPRQQSTRSVNVHMAGVHHHPRRDRHQLATATNNRVDRTSRPGRGHGRGDHAAMEL